MKKILFISIASLILSACGGSSSDDGSTSSQQLTKLQVNDPVVGQKLVFGDGNSIANFNTQVDNKKYYARYAYCAVPDCSDIRIGQMNFLLKNDGGVLKISNIIIDKLGKIYMDNQDIPHYTNLSTGKVSLSTSNLTLVAPVSNRYKLRLVPATSVEDKLPVVDIDVYFNNDGMHIAGADDDYLFVAQQMSNAPAGWGNDINNSTVAGTWKAYETDANLKVLNKSTINVQDTKILEGASLMSVKGAKGNYNGYYKTLGSGYVLGYTEDNQPLRTDGSNYNGISGLIITAPDNQFGIGYDAYDDQSFLLFK